MKSTLVKVVAALALAVAAAGCPAKPPPEQKVPTPATVKSFTASANVVQPGETVTLSWQVADATNVSITSTSGEVVPLTSSTDATGSVDVTVNDDTTWVLTARGEGGSDQSLAAVAVQHDKSELFFSVFPPEIAAGEPVSIVWKAPGTETISVVDANGDSAYDGDERSGSIVVRPAQSTTYTLHVGDRTATGAVHVNPGIVAFSSDVPSAQVGQTITLSWKAAGATEVTLEANGRGTLATITDEAQIADGSVTDTVPALISERNGVVSYRLTARNGDAEASRDLTVYVGVDPMVSSFEVPEFAKEGAQYQVSWSTLEATHLEIAVDGVTVFVAPTAADVKSGMRLFPTPAADAELTLTATNERGGKTVETRTVSPVGVPQPGTFTTSAAVLANGGDAATLSWNVPNARHVKIEAKNGPVLLDLTGKNAETGTLDAYPNKHTEYVLTADNTVGDVLPPQPSVVVDVTNPARLQFNPQFAEAGAQVSLTGTTLTGGGDIELLRGVVMNDPADAFVDISTTGVDISYSGPDSTQKKVTLPETFSTTVFGTPVSSDQISISINGWFVFGSHSNSTDTAVPFPTDKLEPLAIAPYFEDLYDTSTSEIYYQLDTVGSDRRLIVQWNKVEYDPVSGSQLTFEAQVFSSGKIVFAYGALDNATGATPSVGVIDQTETQAVVVPRVPAPGETYRMFGKVNLPVPVVATVEPITARISIGSGFVDVEDTPVNQLVLSEANAVPAAGVTDGQWIELHNKTPDPVDLSGWTLDFGGGSTHVIAANTIVPANAYFVLGQSAGAGDGVTVDYVYGNGFTLPANGAVALVSGPTTISSLSIPASLQAGRAWQQGTTPAGLTLAPDVTQLSCAASSSASYGTHGQLGTPGAPNGTCPGYEFTGAIPANFESIAATGTAVTFSSADDAIATINLTTPVVVDGVSYSSLVVGTNGYLSLVPLTCATSACYRVNETGVGDADPATGLIAPYWDDLELQATGAGVFWERKVPGLAPNDGYTIVSWEHIGYYNQTAQDLNFEVKFFDNGNVEFHYGTFNGEFGSRATSWFEFPDGQAAFILNVNSTTPGIAANTAYRFTAL